MLSKKTKEQSKIENRKSLDQKGFSLIELLIAMAIFSLIIGGVVLFSVRTIQAHTKSQAMQGAIDNARFAVEALNKKIRTSHDINDGAASSYAGTGEVFVVDNIDGSKYCYKFDGTTKGLVMAKYTTTHANYLITSDCSGFAGGDFSPLVGMEATGKIQATGEFYVKDSDESNNQRGFVTTVIKIRYADPGVPPAEQDHFEIQSSVSVRDY